MSDNIPKVRGTTQSYKNDKGGAITRDYPVIGIVKNNIDPERNGRIQVALEDFGKPDADDSKSWITVNYMSPFFGSTSASGAGAGNGSFVGNPHSYGWWCGAPDIGTKVLCIFVNGDINFGYYLGSIPEAGLTHMVPAMGSATDITLNDGEATSYGGATRLPVAEINKNDPKIAGSTQSSSEARPVHSYQAAILNRQGLLRDPDRGTIGSSAMRESPSRVFGVSTPGRPIYEGGFTDETIGSAASTASPEKLKIAGRRGGHSLVMDDGDVGGVDQLMRLRTASGHQILMNDSAETVFIIHANGQSYVELGKEGTVDIYSTNSFNVRTQGDLNLHADNNVNIHATKNLNIHAETISVESDTTTSVRVGSTFSQHTVGAHTLKVDGGMAFAAGGEASMVAGGAAFVNGSKVNLNTGSAGLTPAAVKQLPIVAHTDTMYDSEKGYASAPGKLQSTVSRAPAHSPWANANQGVDVKVDLGAPANTPSAPSAGVQAVNNATPSTPPNPVTQAVAATVPVTKPASPTLDKNITGALLAQTAVNAASGAAKAATTQGAAIIGGASPTSVNPPQLGISLPSSVTGIGSFGADSVAIGKFAQNATQLVESGILKPGADKFVNMSVSAGKSLSEALPSNLFTGKGGITDLGSYVGNTDAQVEAQSTLLAKGEDALKTVGAITGLESATQTGGMILGAATAGVNKVLDYTNNITAGGLGLKLPSMPDIGNANLGSMSDLMSGGKFAAGMADKLTGGLSSLASLVPPNPLDQLKGVAAGAFAKVTSLFKPMKAGVPQNLTTIKAVNDAAAAAEDAAGDSKSLIPTAPTSLLDTAKSLNASLSKIGASVNTGIGDLTSALSQKPANITDALNNVSGAVSKVTDVASKLGMNTSGLGSLPGGLASLGTLVSKAENSNPLASIPSLSSITDSAKSAVAGATGSLNGLMDSAKGLADKVKSSGDSLLSMASTGLPAGALAKLNASIASLGSGGALDIKLPTIAADTVNTDAIQAQSKALLGDARIPALSFGTVAFKVPSVAQAKEYDRLKASLTTEEDNYWATRKAFLDAQYKYGPDAPETKSASEAFKVSSQKLETIKSDLAKAVS